MQLKRSSNRIDRKLECSNCLHNFVLVDLASMTDVETQEHFDEFFEEVFTELQEKVCLIMLHVAFLKPGLLTDCVWSVYSL